MTDSHADRPRPSRFRLPVLVCALLVSFAVSLEARVVYVDGSLSSSCSSSNYSVTARNCSGSSGPAYNTLSAGMAAMAAGDTLAIRAGTYRTPLVVTKSGTASAPIRITAYNGEAVIIDLGRAAQIGIDVSSRQWVEISGLSVRNSSVYGFKGSNGANLSLSDCEIAYSSDGGIIFEQASNVSVRNCSVHHNNQEGLSAWNEAISMVGVDTFEVVNNDVYDNGEEGIDAKYNSRNGTIAYNRAYRNRGPNIYVDSAHSIDVIGNQCYDTSSNQKACIGISIESTYNPNQYVTANVRVINNVIWGSGAGIWFWTESPSATWSVYSNIRIEYNTIVDNATNSWGGVYFVNGGSGNFGSGNTIRNNIIMGNAGRGIRANDSGALARFTIANNLFQSGESSTTTGSGAVLTSTSPFVNRAGKDFHLSDGAVARGIGLGIGDVTTDIEGKPRPAAATDVGAYQWGTVSAGGPPVPPANLRVID